jgi:peroxiredoxin Q/BCP
MKSLFGVFIIFVSLFFNLKSVTAFDFAPEIGDLAPSFHLEGINKSIKSKAVTDLRLKNNDTNIIKTPNKLFIKIRTY